ncbi:hypothetical protein [Glaesserella parasuis]|uniref:O-antigen polymerase n=2 Tax=Glaesserella parasuis TaxID=738 RepID=T1RPR5_GLAPU|nr:hypothetical protein [Glaesserella parasuis]AGM38771.1 hypothetical protein [Glaesserella parasuis]ATW42962.1 hypothetical protein A2U20_03745 [Glaesserella parasuis D74]EQA10644.1 putative membrane protein [Glaesserella parasuis D74]MDG6360460.1 hypothetical protein [Glaesserella parasuis]MDG6447309.1 hypothetical protein [Glaesserella parasuis]
MNILLSYIALFLLVFDLHIPPFRGFGSAPISAVISIFYMLIIDRSRLNYLSNIINQFKYLILCYIFLLFYVFFRVMIDYAEEFSFVGSSLKATSILASSLIYISAFGANKKRLFEKILNIFFINAAICLYIGTYTEYQYIVDFFKVEAKDLIGGTPYRNAFLAGSGYFGIGAAYGLVFAFLLAYIYEHKEQSKIINYFKLTLILIAGVFAARTVFLCAIITILYIIFFKRKFSILIYTVIFILFGLWLLELEIFIPHKLWMLELFYNGTETGSVHAILYGEHLKYPDNIVTIIFGDAHYSLPTGGYYMGTDIGYLRHWFFGGGVFVFSVFGILFFLYFHNRNQMFLYLIIPVCILLHYKGVFIYNNPAGAPLLIIISHILYNAKKDKI